MIYTVRAYWPNVTIDPVTHRCAHFADAFDLALSLMATCKHTTISISTPEALELVRLWGQPPLEGGDWP